jgi:predicted short-subunit dehydrogenase-like oxidoreductase (DUF2520 family)
MKLCQYLNTPKCLNLGGHVLTNLEDSLQAAEVQEGDHLTAAAQQVNISASTQAFALWCCGGSKILTWGNPEYGADCSLVQDQLKNVLQIQATSGAFAAILADGSAVASGNPDDPDWDIKGDCSAVQDELRHVTQIQATVSAIAEVGRWIRGCLGDPEHGGDCSAVQDQLRNVKQIQATFLAIAAILADGSVVTWGDAD